MFSFPYVISPSCLLFFHLHTFPFSLFLLPPPLLLPSPVWLPAVLRSVHHGSVLLCVFDSHLLSFLSLTGLTARPKLDWTVTHRATGENKPPVLRSPLLKSQHHWIMAWPPPPHGRALARINNTQTQKHPHTLSTVCPAGKHERLSCTSHSSSTGSLYIWLIQWLCLSSMWWCEGKDTQRSNRPFKNIQILK